MAGRPYLYDVHVRYSIVPTNISISIGIKPGRPVWSRVVGFQYGVIELSRDLGHLVEV